MTKKKLEITYDNKTAYKLFTNTRKNKKGETRVLWGEQGKGKHINTIVKPTGETSTHVTNENLPEGNNDRNKNILPTTSPQELFESIEKDLVSQMLGKEYFEDDLILLKMDKIQEFLDYIKNNTGKIDIKIISEEEHKEKMKQYTKGSIKRIDLQKMPSPQILTNQKKDILIFFNSKIFDVTEFSQNVFGNMLGTLMGFTKEGIDFEELPNQIQQNLEKPDLNKDE